MEGQSPRLKLSICIATYNRSQYIGETLDSLMSQLASGVEIIIVDGASTDNTEEVLATYQSGHQSIRYIREDENTGMDSGYDKAVLNARGEYCWLMSDDDLLRPGAIKRVLSVIKMQHDLIVVNAEVRSTDFTELLETRRLQYTEDQHFSAREREEFFSNAMKYLSFIGCVVIRREKWMNRDRKSYYGSLFIHVGVIFQHPPLESIKIIADPLITIRYGNAMWSLRSFEIWNFMWPRLVWSFPDYSEKVKHTVCARDPWRRIDYLFYRRATTSYTMETYRRFISDKATPWLRIAARGIAIFPSTIANTLVVIVVALFRRSSALHLYDLLHNVSTTQTARMIARILRIKI